MKTFTLIVPPIIETKVTGLIFAAKRKIYGKVYLVDLYNTHTTIHVINHDGSLTRIAFDDAIKAVKLFHNDFVGWYNKQIKETLPNKNI